LRKTGAWTLAGRPEKSGSDEAASRLIKYVIALVGGGRGIESGLELSVSYPDEIWRINTPCIPDSAEPVLSIVEGGFIQAILLNGEKGSDFQM